jgi:hypothetical protein
MNAPAQLTLYVAGDSAASRRARANLAAVMAEMRIVLPLQVVDVQAEPERALVDHVFMTPALLLQLAGRREMLVGDLSQRDAVRMTLAPLTSSAD